MNFKNFNKRDLISLIIIFILIIFSFFSISKINNMNKKFDNYENSINALNDSIRKTISDGITEYSKKAPEINIDDLINSEYFKTLSSDQQKFYSQLSKIKGLISASSADLQKQGELIEIILANQNPGTILNDSIAFKLGTQLSFKEHDTTKKLQWNSVITLDTTIKFKFNYDYKFNILTTYERQKDKSIIVKYKVDDPDLKINNMQNFIIPIDAKRTKFGQWFENNKKPFLCVGGTVLFVAGGYIGYNLAK